MVKAKNKTKTLKQLNDFLPQGMNTEIAISLTCIRS